MRSVGSIGMLAVALAAALASPTNADDGAAEPSGVWFGEHRGIATRNKDDAPGLGVYEGRGSSFRVLQPGLVILRLEGREDRIDGSVVLATPDLGKEARAIKALGSLGILPEERMPLLEYWNAGPVSGSSENERIELDLLVRSRGNPRGSAYRGKGDVDGDEMRLKLTHAVQDASMVVRLRRCVPPPEQTEAEACSDEALWRRYLEALD